MKEKVLNNKKNGMLVLILTTLLYLLSIAVCVVGAMIGNPLLLGISIFWMCVGWFPYCGLRVLKPQEALVLTLFGKYTGTLKGEGFYAGRQPVLQEMEMTADHWVRFTTGKLAIAKQPMPFKTTIQQPLTDFEDHFTENKLKVDWTWNYPYSDINIVLKKGKLSLSGTPKKDNQRGTALCLRPQSSHYSCETKVIHANESLQGLTLYGDDKNLITWGVKGKQLQLKFIKENSESILYESGAVDKDIYLKIEVEQGCIFNFYKSKDGKIWNPILDTPLKGESLIRWDRVQRPGLLHCGAKEVPAEFAYFRMINLK